MSRTRAKEKAKAKTPKAIDLHKILMRMTNRALHNLREDIQETDFTDNPDLFHFSVRCIAIESGSDWYDVMHALSESSLPWRAKDSETFIWLNDLEERLLKFAA
ncbi:hypothetical protein [Vibrio marisflavi]|uniref:Integron gene cassette protein n=1 Tax=Vibrio marisflavi CECT 7928 TaxID=634439 RepID=A0ABN8EDW9_9VIBR|nr:hypothetical protein [Vibrio marisflavi]CAH0543146.1 hypothetical protein VMF7928_04423 [Vibrio marisflavi CECT 7928]